VPRKPHHPAPNPPEGSRLIIHIDGGARGNPGEAGFGVHVADAEGLTLTSMYGYLGHQTNNVAEYAGLVVALRHAAEAGATSVLIRSDSELLVKQIRGEYRVKNPGLRPLYEEAIRIMEGLPDVKVAHVPRERNREADALANRAMDTRGEDPPGIGEGIPLPRSPGRA
jgi:ribonuclease HI